MIYKGRELEEYKGKSKLNYVDITGKHLGFWYVIRNAALKTVV